MYKKYYKRFLEANVGIQHYASHSHHYWPDVTREAMLEYWDDSARYVDDKWDHIFTNKLPETQKLIASILKLSAPEQIVFAPNTHEFVYRLLSCFDQGKKSEF
jgi:selenocysteine lyase/cysteine desulfurase